MNKQYKYDVAISFAEEDRTTALALALAFRLKNLNAYYYPDKRADTLGDLKENLKTIYRQEARYAVVILSPNYVNPAKEYVQVELAAIQSRMAEETDTVYMVPVKVDRCNNGNADPMQHPAFRGQTYLEWNDEPERIAELIWGMLGRKKEEEGTSPNPGINITGTAINSYNNNNNTQDSHNTTTTNYYR